MESVNQKSPTNLLAGEGMLYLLRHGEIATPGILAGKTDVALSELGHRQLSQATEPLKNISRCISSPLVRCHEWASHHCKQKNLSLAVESKLQEMDFGDWDGKPYQTLWKMAEQSATSSIGDFWQDPWKSQPPNGETMASFVNRVDSWWQDYLTTNTLQNVLVVTHAGVIKHLLARVLNLPIPGTAHMASIEVPYASLIKISLYRDDNGKVWPKLML